MWTTAVFHARVGSENADHQSVPANWTTVFAKVETIPVCEHPPVWLWRASHESNQRSHYHYKKIL
jgi:hypothetical protein